MYFSKLSSRLRVTADLPLSAGKITIDVQTLIILRFFAHTWGGCP